jgi:hypothetical protein
MDGKHHSESGESLGRYDSGSQACSEEFSVDDTGQPSVQATELLYNSEIITQ